jgi:hypothetical protein
LCLYEIQNRLSKQEIEIIKAIREVKDRGWGTVEVFIQDAEIKRLLKSEGQKLEHLREDY